MLALKGKAQVGNMLHVIIGPETELFSDIHGAAVMDITPLLMEMDGEQHVFLTLTHCRSEQVTARHMQSADMTHISSFSGMSKAEKDDATSEAYAAFGSAMASDQSKSSKPKSDTKESEVAHGRCEYCGQDMPLLGLPGFRICKVCAQIELGRLKQNTGDNDESAV